MRHRRPRISATALALAALSTWAFARTWTVDDNGPADFAAIQPAINAAAAGDIVEVRAGTYPENLVMKCGVSVRGAGPDLVTVDGRQLGPVVSIAGCGETTVVEGLRIFNGRAEWGAGLVISGGAPVIRRNTIVGNRAYDPDGLVSGYGGGLALIQTGARILENLIDGNDADLGGGIEIVDGTAQIRGNEIRRNTASYTGGGIDAALQTIQVTVIHGNRILSNTAAYGGGIEIFGNGQAVVTSNLITGNAANDPVQGYGGGVEVFYGDVRMLNNTVVGNQADVGGGIALFSDSDPEVTGNIVARNRAQESGGIDVVGPLSLIRSNILNANQGGDCGGIDGVLCDDPSNLLVDPRFVNEQREDYRLASNSPAIDSSVPLPNVAPDVRGQWRPLDGNGDLTAAYDRGAYEFDRDAVLGVAFTGTPTFTWRAQEGATAYHVYSGLLSTLRILGTDTCRDADDPTRTDLLFTDTTVPPVGEGIAFNVTAVVGGIEQSAGFDSGGLERSLPIHCP